jgi:hypothetical protein
MNNDDHAELSARIDRTNELLHRMLAEVAKTPSTHAIFVDAGYLYAAAGRLVAGTEDRRSYELDAEGLIEALIDKARTIFADSRLLRVYCAAWLIAGAAGGKYSVYGSGYYAIEGRDGVNTLG